MYVFFLKLSRFMAYLGGGMLSALILLTCLSVVGRSLNGLMHIDFMAETAPSLAAWLLGSGLGPISGDYELIEAGIAFAIFAFLPICQISGGHATVDVFTARLSPTKSRWLQTVIDIAFAVVLGVIAVQLLAGTISKYNSGQVTFLLEIPLWWAYALSLCGAGVAAIVGIFMAIARVVELATGQALLPENAGADL